MTDANFRDAIHLVDSALALLDLPRHRRSNDDLRRELRGLAVQASLLRARLGQPASFERN